MSRSAPHLAVAALAALLGLPVVPMAADPAPYVELHIAPERPPCAPVTGLPVDPRDPAAHRAGGRCYGTRGRETVLRLPVDRLVWLQREHGHPAEWLRVGPVIVDARAVGAEPPLGLRIAPSGDAWRLETRYGSAATLAPLRPDAWQQIETADGTRLWLRLDDTPEPDRRFNSAD